MQAAVKQKEEESKLQTEALKKREAEQSRMVALWKKAAEEGVAQRQALEEKHKREVGSVSSPCCLWRDDNNLVDYCREALHVTVLTAFVARHTRQLEDKEREVAAAREAKAMQASARGNGSSPFRRLSK